MPEVTSIVLIFTGLAVLIVAAELYRAIERRRRRHYIDFLTRHHTFSAWRWSQDGWVRQCPQCRTIQYGGDDYDAEPNAAGPVE